MRIKVREAASHKAIDMLGNLHYQICNGGWAQACGNGYVDRMLEEYGSAQAFADAVVKDCEASGVDPSVIEKAVEAAELIALAVKKTDLSDSCSYCGGSGELDYEDGEDPEACDACHGDGFVDVERYSDAAFWDGLNEWAGGWDSTYYGTVDSDAIDDLTNQSHTHSVVLDLINKAKGGLDMKINVREKAVVEAAEEESPIELRKEAAVEKLSHLEDIISSFQPTDREADAAKLEILDYVVASLDAAVNGVEVQMGLKEPAESHEAVSGKYKFSFSNYDRMGGDDKVVTLTAKSDLEAVRKFLKKHGWLGPICAGDSRIIAPTPAELAELEKNGVDSDEVFETLENALAYLEDENGNGCDFVYFIQRPDGSCLFDSGCGPEEEDWDD